MKNKQKNQKVSEEVPTAEVEKKAKKEVTEKKTMTIGETKLGLTLVISKENCKKLGYTDEMTTKEAILGIKEKLGIA